jgi:hypothetical protein
VWAIFLAGIIGFGGGFSLGLVLRDLRKMRHASRGRGTKTRPLM